MEFVIWIGKSLLILFIFHFLVSPSIDGLTRNGRAKIPVTILAAVAAAAFMAWLHYVPFLLFFVWMGLTHFGVKEMETPAFAERTNLVINPQLFYGCAYLYVIVSCGLAWLFQIEIVSGDEPARKFLF